MWIILSILRCYGRHTLMLQCGFPRPLPLPRSHRAQPVFPFCPPSEFISNHCYILSSNSTLNTYHLMLSLQQPILWVKKQKLRKINLSKVARIAGGQYGTWTQIGLSAKLWFFPLYTILASQRNTFVTPNVVWLLIASEYTFSFVKDEEPILILQRTVSK